ncbi:protein LURP-one-related 10-like [Zingiber officinale]|uniref:protein LURP-one-related 10-like n=1 Tax=Zingiber officinale TaxID=94328 RepID=UPI001C4B5AE4|nr:protein LURP-one-related 10-like [Zingiber officinale]
MAEYGQTARHVAPAELVAARQFTVPYAVNLTLTRTGGLFSSDLYKVKDTNGDVVFKVKGVFFSSRRLLLDAAGTPLLTMKPKGFSRWRVFRGESSSPDDLLFSLRKSKTFRRKDNFDVFLATNTDEAAPCDFKIIGQSKECTICIGETDEIIAQMHRKTAFFARDELEITVNPNEDFAFIVSLIVIQETEANRRHDDLHHQHHLHHQQHLHLHHQQHHHHVLHHHHHHHG